MVIKYPIIVEGKYDKIKLDSILSAKIITTDGFGIFNNKEKLSLIRQLALKDKIILLTDSDGGGHLIRSHIKTAIPSDKLINLYIPRVEGKEKRKSAPSKEGVLGVEGIDADKLRQMLLPYSDEGTEKQLNEITKSDFYALGLSGRDDSKALREKILKKLNFPTNMSPNAMLQAVNILFSKEEFEKVVSGLWSVASN
jgi:ribonuclease M5